MPKEKKQTRPQCPDCGRTSNHTPTCRTLLRQVDLEMMIPARKR